jgi:hypothetical protein
MTVKARRALTGATTNPGHDLDVRIADGREGLKRVKRTH